MKKCMKKILSLFLSLTMIMGVCSGFSINAYALENSWTSGSTTVKYNENTGVLTVSGNGEMADYTAASAPAWTNNNKYDKLTKVVIEKGVTAIGNWAFSNMYSLISVQIPDTVESIGDRAFSGSRSITVIDIPSSVTSIGTAAFRTASESIKSDLEAINVDSENAYYSSADGILYNKNKTVLINIPSSTELTRLEIPSAVETVMDQAGVNCSSLTEIVVPESVSTIGAKAFLKCNNLQNVYFFSKKGLVIGDSVVTADENLTFHGYTDSSAYLYAKNNSINFDNFPVVTFKSADGKTVICEYAPGTKAADIIVPESSPALSNGDGTHTEYNWSPEIQDVSQDITYTETEKTEECSYAEGEVLTPATVDKNGEISAQCKICGYKNTSLIIYSPAEMKLSNTSYEYTGKDIGPGVTVKDSKGNTLIYRTDYTLTYQEGRTDAGRYAVTINFIGKYAGSETLYFDITPIPASKCTAKLSSTSYAYTGRDIGPGVSVVDHAGRKLVYKTDYTLTYAPGRVQPGRYSVVVNYMGNYSGSTTLYFTINAVPEKMLTPKLSSTSYVYTGKDIGPGVTVKDGNGKTLKYKTDYTLTYQAGRTNVGRYAVTVNYIGKYAGISSETLYFDITAKPASQCTAKLSSASYEYTGKDIGPGVSIVDNNGRKLVYRTDYSLVYDEGRTQPGTYSVVVNYMGNYSGSIVLYFTINEPVTITPKLSATTYYYTGKDIGPGVSVTDSNGKKLVYKTDYSLVYDEGRTELGTYSVTVNYIGKYAGRESEILYFDIVAKPASQCTVKPSAWSYYYTGRDIGPGITVTDNTGRKLVYKTDYTLTYDEGRTNVGRYFITVNYMGNYTGSQTIYFYIIPKQVAIKSLTPDRLNQGFNVEWYTQPEEITGYHVQYSQYSNFSNSATLTFANPATSSVTRTKMGANKKYYVRVRTYKNLTIDGKATTLFSGWSDVKTVVVEEVLSLNRSAYEVSLTSSNVSYVRYGTSVQGRPLEAFIISNGSNYTGTFVMDFAIHGFEDNYYRDGQVLVEEANQLVEYYAKNPSKLKNMRLVIIPCLNPDGTMAGTNNQRACSTAFGRCTANHIDMNRDFGNGLFRASESVSYRSFLNRYQPDVYLNFHGWDDESIGSADLCNIITPALGLSGRKPNRFGADSGYAIGYVNNTYNCPAAIVEFASPYRVDHGDVCNMINSIINKYNS